MHWCSSLSVKSIMGGLTPEHISVLPGDDMVCECAYAYDALGGVMTGDTSIVIRV